MTPDIHAARSKAHRLEARALSLQGPNRTVERANLLRQAAMLRRQIQRETRG